MASLLERFPHNPLTPLDSDLEPTPMAVRQLRRQVYDNATAIKSPLGGGQHGHLGMVMPDPEYRTMSRGGVAYVEAVEPAIPNYNGTAAQAKKRDKEYDKAMKLYEEAEAVRETLKQQIMQAVPHHFLEEKNDPNVGFTNETPKSLVQYMVTAYGEITMHALYLNRKELEMRWDPTTNISKVFSNGTRCRAFANEGNDPITDIQYVHSLVMVLRLREAAVSLQGVPDRVRLRVMTV
jgi:hypothetical protein